MEQSKDLNITYIDPNLIFPNIYQPRKVFNNESIDELADSIKTYGIIQPLSVRQISNDYFELVAGERRLRAAKSIGLKKVPVILIEISDRDSAAIALLENLQREDLSFLEEAQAYYELLKDHNFTQDLLAKSIGKKQSTIANKLRVLKLEPKLRELILENKLKERHARALLKLESYEDRQKVLNRVIDNKLNVKDTESLIEKYILKTIHKDKNIGKDGKKRIKGVFGSTIYINTIKQVFDKYGIDAKYDSKESDDFIEVTVKIPKN